MNVPAYLPGYLTSEQRDAILHTGSPLLVIAGPGSGKTEVIAWRVAHLVRAGLVAPEHLLVTTFTNKAALELKDRIQQKLPDVHVEAMQVGALHSFCADLLRRYQSRSPLPRGFHILDQHGQFLFVYTRRKALGLNALVKGRPHAFFSDVLRLFNLATEELVEPERLGGWCECRRAEAEACAAGLADGRSKTRAKKAAGELERWCEERVASGPAQAVGVDRPQAARAGQAAHLFVGGVLQIVGHHRLPVAVRASRIPRAAVRPGRAQPARGRL